ncbi:type II toxin-antitoxin system prevent-host-death family antitoxin [Argonema antarcticum]|uniref:type II toxin-antitoxin system prevent-host-death family antitoxin n=1 Tax=Argonema antarcticum TaxID=2942763 RepID=UPI002013278B|nr:type II toxin-antitoxin system prevent-host-death family antitoxin [Argonema antarcticum]MCL1473159.1 type II toxin-antitoxin system Phd/YefM family antitoxin [Argonema antarcticum A004/B2]
MIELHPEYLSKNGKKEFVVLPYEEFEALQELLEDLEDLRNAKQEDADKPSISLAEVKKQLRLSE